MSQSSLAAVSREDAIRAAVVDPEIRKEIARRMYTPIRCGGMDYDQQGNRIHWIGGNPLNDEQFFELIKKVNPGWDPDKLREMHGI